MAANEEKEEMDIEMQVTGDEAVKFIQPNHNGSIGDAPKIEFSGLTKEELAKYANDPFWKKIRWVLFIAFWIVWIGMLAAAIVIIIIAPKCPKKHNQDFWEKKIGYWIDPFAFKDSNGDSIGDIKGIIEKIDYVKDEVKSGYIILDSIFEGQFSDSGKYLGAITSFKEINSALGTWDDFKLLIKTARKKEIEIVLTIDPLSVSKEHLLIKDKKYYLNNSADWKTIQGKSAGCKLNGIGNVYTSFGSPQKECVLVDLDLSKDEVVQEFQDIVSFWSEKGVRGFLFTNVPLYGKNFNNNDDLPDVPNLKKGQVYQNSSVNFLSKIRETLVKKSEMSDKSMLLIADSGNVGFGTEYKDMEMYLGLKLANLVVSSAFLRGRGWRYRNVAKNMTQSAILNYIVNLPNNGSDNPTPILALTTASPYNVRTTYLPSIGAAHLLPGATIVYFGSEITDEKDEVVAKDNDFSTGKFQVKTLSNYPKSSRTLSYSQLSKDSNILAYDSVNRYSMNWDDRQSDSYKNSVLRMTAAGRGDTLFHLYNKLATLRAEPSFLWGSINVIDQGTDNVEVFTRSAAGFPKYVVVLIHGRGSEKSNIFLELKDEECEKAMPQLLQPGNPSLPLETEISTKSIMFLNRESINVLKCL